MGKSAPKAPDPNKTAAAQTATNIGTAVSNAWLGNVNQVTPDGTLKYDQTGTYKYTDPLTGKSTDIPTFTATQTLSPAQQAIKTQSDAAQLNLAKLGNQQSDRLGNLLSTPFSLSGAPAAADPSKLTTPNYQSYGAGPQLQKSVGDTGQITQNIANAGNIQTAIGNAGKITKSYGTDYASNVQDVQNALMSRLQPQIDQDRAALEQRLAGQGIQIGSKAYDTAMNQFNQGVNDQRTQALLAASQEQSRLAGLAQNQAAFQNSAQQQQYNQLANSGQFANAAQAQQYSQNANNASFANSAQKQAYQQALSNAGLNNNALQQMYANSTQATQNNNSLAGQKFSDQQTQMNAQNQARSNYLNEQYALRNQPINEISALLSGSQVTNPQFVNTSMPSIATTDTAGIINQNYQNQLGAWQQQNALTGNVLGGLFGLGAAGIMASDKRVKEDIKPVGKLMGQNLYEYSYKGKFDDGQRHIGVMAQEVEKKRPDAVVEGGDGIKRVDYGRLFEMGKKAA